MNNNTPNTENQSEQHAWKAPNGTAYLAAKETELLRVISNEKDCLEYLTTRRDVIGGEYKAAQECVLECKERILKWEKDLDALSK